MNSIERLTKLSGITTIIEAFGEKKYADRDKAGLLAVKKELQGILANAARASFKYKNAAEELKVVEGCLKKLEEPEKKDVKEGEVVDGTLIENGDAREAILKKDKEDKKESDKDDKEDKKPDFLKKKDKDSDDDKDDDSEKKSDKKDDDKDSDKKEDKDKKESKKDDDDEDSDKDDKKKDKKEDDKESDKKSDKDDSKDDDKDSDDEKKIKVEVKVEENQESVEEIVARILEKDLTPTKVEVDYQNGPTENSGIKLERGTKIRVPSAVKSEVKQRISELNEAILRYDDKGYNDKSVKQQAVDCLNQIMQDLSTNDLEGVKKAQIYFETLMSPLTDFFPPKLINWLANALNPYVDNESA